MTARLPKSWGKSGSKMRNKPVWECDNCGSDFTDACLAMFGTTKTKQCVNCGRKLTRHASKKEYRRWCELKQLEKRGEIRNLRRQVRFPLEVNGVQLRTPGSGKRKPQDMVYVADFVYEECCHPDPTKPSIVQLAWFGIVEDTKGRKSGNAYDLFHLKREIMRAMGYEIRES